MTNCDGCEYIQGGEEQFFKFHVKSENVYGTVDLDIRTKKNQLCTYQIQSDDLD